MKLSEYSTSDKEIILYAYICKYIDLNNCNYKFLSNSYGMGYFGVEFEIDNNIVSYVFEKGYGEVLINNIKVDGVKQEFNEESIIENIKLIQRRIL